MSALLLILSAPSGTGKTTLARRLCAAHAGAMFSVSVTTRAPRGQERDGVDYRFVDDAAFERMVREGAFLEWAEVHGHRYGTPRAVVEEAQRRGVLALFDIDVQGGESIRRQYPEAVRVLVLPPSLRALEERLRSRKTDDESTIRRRMEAARREIERARSYEYWVVNDDLERAFGDLEAIVRAERLRGGRRDLDAILDIDGPRGS
jgi:guanylate kinase